MRCEVVNDNFLIKRLVNKKINNNNIGKKVIIFEAIRLAANGVKMDT